MGFFQNSGMGNDVFNVSFQKGVEFKYNSAYRLFNGCTNFNAPVKIPDYAQDITYMFNGCANFNSNVYIDPYESKATRMGGMFNGCTLFNKNVNIPYLCGDIYSLLPYGYNATLHIYSQGKTYANQGEVGLFNYYCSQMNGNFNVIFHDVEPISISHMFYECYNLNTNINVPTSVRDESGAFQYCENLNKNIHLHDRTNAAGCFYACRNLNQNIRVPRLGNISEMFVGCYNLNQPIYVPEVNGNTWEEQRNNIQRIFSGCTNLNSRITIDSNIKSMCGMFVSCSNLDKPITIPSNVVDIERAFDGCSNLRQTIQVPSSVRYMDYAFAGCYNMSVFPGVPGGVQSLTNTFSGTNISHITALPSGLESMAHTFDGCRSLNDTISIPSSVTYMAGTFYGCSNFNTRISLPDDVIQLGGCFAYCKNLNVEITIPENCPAVMSLFQGSENYAHPVTVGHNVQWVTNICAGTKIPTFTDMGANFNAMMWYNLTAIRNNAFKNMVAEHSENTTVFNIRVNKDAVVLNATPDYNLHSFFTSAYFGSYICGIYDWRNRCPHNYQDYTQNYHDGFGGCMSTFTNSQEADGHCYMMYYDYPNATADHTPAYYINLYFV